LNLWTELIEMRSILVPSPQIAIEFPRDPKDALFLSAALATAADYLITGDNDLLFAKVSMQTRTISVNAFAAEFQIS
jgi:putative PIN family toxin of toxin-antitoxin system